MLFNQFKLTSLNSSHNRIEFIELNSFQNQIELKILDLSVNRKLSIQWIDEFKWFIFIK